MQDHRVHGLLGSNPPQTYCGLNPFGHKASTDATKVNCPFCMDVMRKINALPTQAEIPVELPRRAKKVR